MEFRHCVYVHMCVYVRVFIQFDITAQSSRHSINSQSMPLALVLSY